MDRLSVELNYVRTETPIKDSSMVVLLVFLCIYVHVLWPCTIFFSVQNNWSDERPGEEADEICPATGVPWWSRSRKDASLQDTGAVQCPQELFQPALDLALVGRVSQVHYRLCSSSAPVLIFWTVSCNVAVPPNHLLLDRSSNIGPLISRWELGQLKNCWNKRFRTSKMLTIL